MTGPALVQTKDCPLGDGEGKTSATMNSAIAEPSSIQKFKEKAKSLKIVNQQQCWLRKWQCNGTCPMLSCCWIGPRSIGGCKSPHFVIWRKSSQSGSSVVLNPLNPCAPNKPSALFPKCAVLSFCAPNNPNCPLLNNPPCFINALRICRKGFPFMKASHPVAVVSCLYCTAWTLLSSKTQISPFPSFLSGWIWS